MLVPSLRLGWVCLALSACASVVEPPPGAVAESAQFSAPPSAPVWSGRVLHERSGEDCPEASAGWKLRVELRDWCMYEAHGDNDRPLHEDEVRPLRIDGELVEDLAVVSPMGLAEVLDGAMQADFAHRAGQLSQSLPPDATEVWVSLLDTMPSREPTDAAPDCEQESCGINPHGVILSETIRTLLCPEADCPVKVGAELALDLRIEDGALVRDPEGGDLGSILGLAASVVDAVERFEEQSAAKHLVLNLSVAWLDDAHTPTEVGERGPEVRRFMVDVLDWAACRGVLVFAAAGNNTGGQLFQQGTMSPAEFFHREMPMDCDVRVRVQSVGAVVADGSRLLPTSRPLSTPNLVAHGQAAKVDGYPPLSGTSVSTAVVSAAAAAIWSTDAHLGRVDVHRRLWSQPADGPFQRQPDRSGALDRTHASVVRVCEAIGACGDPPVVEPVDWSAFDKTAYTMAPLAAAMPGDDRCSLALVWADPRWPLSDPCPIRQFYSPAAGTTGLVGTQPHVPTCPYCTVSKFDGQVRGEISGTVPDSISLLRIDTATNAFHDEDERRFHAFALESLPKGLSSFRWRVPPSGELDSWMIVFKYGESVSIEPLVELP